MKKLEISSSVSEIAKELANIFSFLFEKYKNYFQYGKSIIFLDKEELDEEEYSEKLPDLDEIDFRNPTNGSTKGYYVISAYSDGTLYCQDASDDTTDPVMKEFSDLASHTDAVSLLYQMEDFLLKKMPSKRELAMDWWNNLSWTEKGNLMEGELKHRHPQSLTESEIEKLWLNCI